MSDRILEIGLVGCGEWGRLVLRDLVTLGARAHVVARSAESKARAAAGAAASIVPAIEDLPKVAGMVVVLPTGVAPPAIEAALGRGVPVFTEKPLAGDGATARKLVEVGGGRLFVMDKWRYQAGVVEMARVVRSGAMGAPIGLQTRRLGPAQWGPEVDPILRLAPHDLAIAREVLGALPSPVAAVGQRDDDGIAGMTGVLSGHAWMTLEVSVRYPVHEREVRLHLEAGGLRLATADLAQLEVYTAATRQWRVQPCPGEMPLLAELRAFLEHIRGGPPPRSTAAEAAEAAGVLDELRRMAGLGD